MLLLSSGFLFNLFLFYFSLFFFPFLTLFKFGAGCCFVHLKGYAPCPFFSFHLNNKTNPKYSFHSTCIVGPEIYLPQK